MEYTLTIMHVIDNKDHCKNIFLKNNKGKELFRICKRYQCDSFKEFEHFTKEEEEIFIQCDYNKFIQFLIDKGEFPCMINSYLVERRKVNTDIFKLFLGNNVLYEQEYSYNYHDFEKIEILKVSDKSK